jgi:transcription initiation factor IIE alpha subunit
MKDQIPLQESQILIEDGIFKCPVCKGKLQTSSSDNPREFPLVKRESGFVFPGFVDYKSPKNNKNMQGIKSLKKNLKIDIDEIENS